MMSTRWARFTRGWLIAAFSVFVAALSHSFAGGVTPGWLAIVLSLAFASMLSIGLSGKSRAGAGRAAAAPWRLVLSVAGSQLVFHGLFSLFGAQLAVAPAAGAGHAGHHLSSAEIAAQLSALAPAGVAPVLADAHHDTWMLLGHSLAGLLTIAAILRGEHAARGLLRTAGLALRALAPRPLIVASIPDAAPARPVAPAVWVPRPLDVVQGALRHRGPPALARA